MPGRFVKPRIRFETGMWTLALGRELDRVLGHLSDAVSVLMGSPSAPTDVAPDNVAAGGSGPKPALDDHVHAFPVDAPAGLGNANAEGSSNASVRSDHVHKRDVRVSKASVDIGTRNRLNFIAGAAVTLTVADNPGSDQVDVTVAATGVPLSSVVSKAFADSPYTVPTTVDVVLVDATGGAVVVSLPTAAAGSGHVFTVKKTDLSANAVTVTANGVETIDGSTTQPLSSQWQSVTVVSSGLAWFIIGFNV